MIIGRTHRSHPPLCHHLLGSCPTAGYRFGLTCANTNTNKNANTKTNKNTNTNTYLAAAPLHVVDCV